MISISIRSGTDSGLSKFNDSLCARLYQNIIANVEYLLEKFQRLRARRSNLHRFNPPYLIDATYQTHRVRFRICVSVCVCVCVYLRYTLLQLI